MMGPVKSERRISSDSPLAGRLVAVVGAGGFIGTRLVDVLVREHGANVIATVRNRKRAAWLSVVGAEVRQANLLQASRIREAISGCDVVFNLAYDFRATSNENLAGFDNLVAACAARDDALLVHVSSIAVYDDWPAGDLAEGSPRERAGSEYKNTKMSMERKLATLASNGSLRSVIVQPTVVYGPHSWLWTDHLVERLLTGIVILPDEGRGLCNTVYVDDVAQAMTLAAIHQHQFAAGEAFIISGAEPVTWCEFYESMATALGVQSVKYVPSEELLRSQQRPTPTMLRALIESPLVRRGLNMAYRTASPKVIRRLKSISLQWRRRRNRTIYFPNTSEFELYNSHGRCSIAKARQQLGYVPTFDFAAGLQLTAEYVRKKYL